MAGRVVVVTGASAGIGRAAARAFAGHGDDVALLARGEAGLEAAVKEVQSAGGRAVMVPTDVADHEQVEGAAFIIEEELGPIDVWVNNAFSSVFAPSWETSAEESRRLTDVTYLGYVWGTNAALRRMRTRNRGTIVQVGSALAYRGIPLQAGYCGAKHAIQGFSESVRCELIDEDSDIRITDVQLPAVNTPQFSWVVARLPREPQPVPPIYQPEVAARAIVHAAYHPRRREYRVGASTTLTLLGNAIAPGLLDRYLGRTGVESQQTEEPVSANRRGNLWEPLDEDEDHGAHDDRAHARSTSGGPPPTAGCWPGRAPLRRLPPPPGTDGLGSGARLLQERRIVGPDLEHQAQMTSEVATNGGGDAAGHPQQHRPAMTPAEPGHQ